MKPVFAAARTDLDFEPCRNDNPQTLNSQQIATYNEDGFIAPLPIFDADEATRNREYFDWLLQEVLKTGDGQNHYSINGYHTRCAKLWDLVTQPRILDCVQDLLGPNLVGWGSHFFAKLPHDPMAVPFHQDASYWPLSPARTVTVWLAIDDADQENAAMMFIPGTHKQGHLQWREAEGDVVLSQQIENIEQYGEPVFDELKAGEISLHADMLAHGSTANASDRRRCGLTIRYCPMSVCADKGWNADSIWCRGEDESGHWANNPRPDGENIDPANWKRKATAIAAG